MGVILGALVVGIACGLSVGTVEGLTVGVYVETPFGVVAEEEEISVEVLVGALVESALCKDVDKTRKKYVSHKKKKSVQTTMNYNS